MTQIAPLPVSPTAAYRRAFLQHAGSGCPPRVIGFAGELSALKGADVLPAMFRTLTPEYEFRIAGSGPLAADLAGCVAALPAAQRARVVLAGAIPPTGMPGFYCGVDCLLVPSRSEAHSRVTLEAMLAGVIALASATCGSADLVIDGKTGMIICPDDPATVATALAALAADPGRTQAIRKRAASFAATQAASSRSGWLRLLGSVCPQTHPAASSNLA